jgi:hypothetical protein
MCHTCCDTGPQFFRSHLKDRPIVSPLTTNKGMWRINSYPDAHGEVWMGGNDELQIFLGLLHFILALHNLFEIYSSHSPFDVTTPSRYVNVSTSLMFVQSILTCSLISDLILIILVFLVFIFISTQLAFSCSGCVFC